MNDPLTRRPWEYDPGAGEVITADGVCIGTVAVPDNEDVNRTRWKAGDDGPDIHLTGDQLNAIADANGRLMAAAPELYGAALLVLAAYFAWRADSPDPSGETGPLAREVALLREAVSKAEGGGA